MSLKRITIEFENGRSISIAGPELSGTIKKKLSKEVQRFIQPKPVMITEPGFYKAEE